MFVRQPAPPPPFHPPVHEALRTGLGPPPAVGDSVVEETSRARTADLREPRRAQLLRYGEYLYVVILLTALTQGPVLSLLLRQTQRAHADRQRDRRDLSRRPSACAHAARTARAPESGQGAGPIVHSRARRVAGVVHDLVDEPARQRRGSDRARRDDRSRAVPGSKLRGLDAHLLSRIRHAAGLARERLGDQSRLVRGRRRGVDRHRDLLQSKLVGTACGLRHRCDRHCHRLADLATTSLRVARSDGTRGARRAGPEPPSARQIGHVVDDAGRLPPHLRCVDDHCPAAEVRSGTIAAVATLRRHARAGATRV